MRIRAEKRRGATIVESAFVLPIVLLLLVGLFEYCRFVFFIQLAENAAREGARYAVARTADGTTSSAVTAFVTDKLAGRQTELAAGWTITLAYVDPTTGTAIPSTNWNDAPFSASIVVRISGTYTPMLSSYSRIPATIPFTVSSMMGSEAN